MASAALALAVSLRAQTVPPERIVSWGAYVVRAARASSHRCVNSASHTSTPSTQR